MLSDKLVCGPILQLLTLREKSLIKEQRQLYRYKYFLPITWHSNLLWLSVTTRATPSPSRSYSFTLPFHGLFQAVFAESVSTFCLHRFPHYAFTYWTRIFRWNVWNKRVFKTRHHDLRQSKRSRAVPSMLLYCLVFFFFCFLHHYQQVTHGQRTAV